MKLAAHTRQKKKVIISKKHYESDATLSTDTGELSSNEFSDISCYTEAGAGMSRVTHSAIRARKAPGLTVMESRKSATVASHGCTLDAQPNSQQLRNSIQMLKGALSEWEANLPTSASEPLPVPLNLDESSSLLAALAKLTPEQATTVRSMLDNKLGAHNTPATRRTPTQKRPFTPFQGSRNPWDQTRPDNSRIKGSTTTKALVPRPEGVEEESLQTQLRDLSLIDNSRVLMVRKINRLGLNSDAPLKRHFSQFGEIERVMVAPTRSKGQLGQANTRVRPAPLGFLVMSKAEAANAALQHGAEHIVDGQTIGVLPFTTHSIEPSA